MLYAPALASVCDRPARYKIVDPGAAPDGDLAAFIRTEIASAEINGPSLLLDPKRALALGLVFHELATNAGKYGALSKAKGRIAVIWAVKEDRLVVVWRERGGPKVRPSTRRGFGTELIERQIRSALDGEVRFDYRPEGIVVHISIPYEKITPPTAVSG